jgi:hypothetical protein
MVDAVKENKRVLFLFFYFVGENVGEIYLMQATTKIILYNFRIKKNGKLTDGKNDLGF